MSSKCDRTLFAEDVASSSCNTNNGDDVMYSAPSIHSSVVVIIKTLLKIRYNRNRNKNVLGHTAEQDSQADMDTDS